MGELSLSGNISAVTGVLPAAIGAAASGLGLICPYDRGVEASFAGDIEIIAAQSLTALINHLRGEQVLAPPQPGSKPTAASLPDMADLVGQFTARRVLEITAAGGHNLLMMGPPARESRCWRRACRGYCRIYLQPKRLRSR